MSLVAGENCLPFPVIEKSRERFGFVVQEVFPDQLALVTKAKDKILVAEMSIVLHQVPDYRSRADRHQRLWESYLSARAAGSPDHRKKLQPSLITPPLIHIGVFQQARILEIACDLPQLGQLDPRATSNPLDRMLAIGLIQ